MCNQQGVDLTDVFKMLRVAKTSFYRYAKFYQDYIRERPGWLLTGLSMSQVLKFGNSIVKLWEDKNHPDEMSEYIKVNCAASRRAVLLPLCCCCALAAVLCCRRHADPMPHYRNLLKDSVSLLTVHFMALLLRNKLTSLPTRKPHSTTFSSLITKQIPALCRWSRRSLL